MPLPKISHPVHELVLPSTKQKIQYRPFLVKEEKILLMAIQGQDAEEIINSIKQVISNCIINDDIKYDDLTTFDIEYLFVKIRSKSVNNIINLTYRDLEDNNKYDVEVNLDDVEMVFDKDHNNKIEISDSMGFYLKYPKGSVSESIKDSQTETDLFFKVLKECLDKIYDSENVYIASDYSEEEIEEFIQNLDVKTFNKIQKFFSTMPKLYYEVKYTNSLGKEKKIPLTSLNDFFTLG